MSQKAYDACYFDSMIQKTRYLFKLLGRNAEDPLQSVEEYLTGTDRSCMDTGNPRYLNKTPKQIMGNMGIPIRTNFEISEDYDESILEWMADVYTYLQWEYNLPSSQIAEKIKPRQLYEQYFPLHEASISNCAEKLRKIYKI